MTAIVMRLRAELRTGWRPLVSLMLIVGFAGGCAIAAAAGARRSDTAYPRFLRAHDSFHASSSGGAEGDFDRRFAALPRLPEVARAELIVIMGAGVTVPARRGRPEQRVGFPDIFLATSPAARVMYQTNRAKVLRGRLPDKTVPDEAVAPFTFAERVGLEVGDTIIAGIGFDESFEPARQVPVRIVGIVAAPGDFRAVGQTTFSSLFLSPASFERHKDVIPPPNSETWNYGFHLKGGPAAAPGFKQRVETTLNFDVPIIEPVITSGVQKTMRLYVAALWLLAGLIAVATIAIFGQVFARQALLESSEYPALRALGMGRSHLAMLVFARAALVGIGAAVLAGATAFLLSPLAPIGDAGVAEPDPGFAFDVSAIGIGAGALVFGVLALSLMPALRSASHAAARIGHETLSSGARPSRAAGAIARAFRSPAAETGLRMALEPGRGRTAVPVRSTILAVAIGVAAVTGALIVARSLDHLVQTPALAGFTYDAIVPNESDEPDDVRRRRILGSPVVERATYGTALNITIAGVDSFLVSLESAGRIGFAMIEGSAPGDRLQRGAGSSQAIPEIALGPATMRRMGLRVGDVVTFSHGREEGDAEVRVNQRALVVGTAAIPPLPWAATAPGEGAAMSLGAVRTFSDEGLGGCCFIAFKPGTDLIDARAALERAGESVFVRTQRAELITLERIAAMPALLAALFALIAVAALTHVLVSAIRRRRRDIAILKTLGFVTSQVRASLAWQATAIAVLCLAVGIPAGLLVGRWGWRAVAGQFGVVPVDVAPLAALGVAIPVAVLVANLVAALPARVAARTQPAIVLRSE